MERSLQFRRYTEEQLREAVRTSFSIRESLFKLGIKPAGGNYWVIKKYIKTLNIDISHFTGKAWNKGRIFGPKQPIEEYFNGRAIQSDKLKRRILKEGVKPYKCECCNRTKWNQQPIPLELDHINGKRDDNTLSNLRLLCPNCHAQTETYRGKNIGKCGTN